MSHHGSSFQRDDPDRLGRLYEAELAQPRAAARRQARGIFYTPRAVVDFLVERTLGPLLASVPAADISKLKILDPACGCGAFLLGAYRRLAQSNAEPSAITRQLLGIDSDAKAIAIARRALAQETGTSAQAFSRIRAADALARDRPWLGGGIDLILGNPPYVNIRKLTRGLSRRTLDDFRRRYRCARGAFDLYVLFIERAIESLREGGRLGLVVPNKLATLDYARECRELLLSRGTLDEVVDVSPLRIFEGAGVYPYLITWTKGRPPRDHRISVSRPAALDDLPAASARPTLVLQSAQSPSGLRLHGDRDVESLVPTAPLGELCAIHSGATGFQAEELASQLAERSSLNQPAFDFIVSGNIDPYSIRLGDVRFMGRRLAWPALPADAPILSPQKRRLYAQEKIVLAGMSRRIEAAFDCRRLALGVQVYALADWRVDPLYLLGLLNSQLLSELFRLRFAAKRLAGGYLSLNKGQLSRLPIRVIRPGCQSDRRLHDQLVQLVQQRQKSCGPLAAALDARVDDVVGQLYRTQVPQRRAA